MTKIVFTNQKGGVGKTTLTRELGCYLAHEKGLKTLLVDCDSQGNPFQKFFLISRELDFMKP